ncbi:hypothetical protein A2574_03115 [Candidatus Shapirobacteria bacterium RIFOXYD1_FULL_38_32]|uniref:Uncharacterized protein n=4 Tax=Patescibacteria group TaxID=1783273 RepID=A0A0G0JIZ8_9BACT|nr:MAG: hypothetical protein US90_C0032G0008 [Candidatus Shapirobacteria bacterium GW2011_GWE2_38_30]KKQ90694.1 MAG: hypothetical protein UT14_C0031G0010 [Candidatus Shapirobacteria bacterium GW2011_GWE1_38_92]OGJ06432.1 MAG: hypothetical protein A2192_02440 [Candidatus Nomurabacteria bacterium RIFOXYA1_FULL_35_17]OGL56348.1 MAG: hypothetical protein A2410_01890 [Candidatus Shapirobacteria bacterium RIFOXYC1_FULL_38_24]OGL56491.1 MAG: hypothetical protein A2367_02820 [Candidatus Shapirobacteria
MSGQYDGEEIVSWNVSGTWLLDFNSGIDNRVFRNLIQDEEGKVTGEFYYLSGENWLKGGTLVGNVVGDVLTLHYDRAPDFDYTGDFIATITTTGLTGGIFTDSHNNNLIWTAMGVEPAIYNTCSWNYFVKIVAAPSDAKLEGGYWKSSDGEEIGPAIWGEFAIIQEVSNDTCTGDHGLLYKSLVRAGLGNW